MQSSEGGSRLVCGVQRANRRAGARLPGERGLEGESEVRGVGAGSSCLPWSWAGLYSEHRGSYWRM